MQRPDRDEVRSRLPQQLFDLARHRHVTLIQKLVVELALGFRIVKALLIQLERASASPFFQALTMSPMICCVPSILSRKSRNMAFCSLRAQSIQHRQLLVTGFQFNHSLAARVSFLDQVVVDSRVRAKSQLLQFDRR